MKIYIVFLLAGSLFIQKNKEKKICNIDFIIKKSSVYLKDYNLEVNFVSMLNPKTKKFVFGFKDSTYRNDTLFIYSKFIENKNELITTTYYKHNISTSFDSTKNYYVCKESKVKLLRYEKYQNGVLTGSSTFK